MFRAAPVAEGRDRFSCALPTWEFLRELGRTFGWRPRGTTYVQPPGRKRSEPAPRNYQPGNALDRKWVDTDDALAWARALDVARRSAYVEAMIEAYRRAQDDAGPTPEQLVLLIEQFIEFLRFGAFEFAIAPAEDARASRR